MPIYIHLYLHTCESLDMACKKQGLVKVSSPSPLKSGLNWLFKCILSACSSSNKKTILEISWVALKIHELYNQSQSSLLGLHFLILRKYIYIYIYVCMYICLCKSLIFESMQFETILHSLAKKKFLINVVLRTVTLQQFRWVFCI